MRSTVALAALFLAATAAPSVALPMAPNAGSEAVNWRKAGEITGEVGRTLLRVLREEDPILARAFEDELLARDIPPAGSEALHINWKGIGNGFKDFGKGVLGLREDELLAREDELMARAFEDELLARDVPPAGSEALHINWKGIGNGFKDFGKGVLGLREEELMTREDELMARAFEDELLARDVPPAGSEALHINWKGVGNGFKDFGKGVLGLREEELMAREDELMARAFEDELMAREDELMARAFEDELLARDVPPAGSEALHINWKGVGNGFKDFGKGVLGLREEELMAREDELMARAFEDELLARDVPPAGSEALHINWNKVGNVAGTIGKALLHLAREDPLLARALEEELMARGDELVARGAPPAGSEALHINWKKVGQKIKGALSIFGKTLLKFIREDDPVLARAFEERLMARFDMNELD